MKRTIFLLAVLLSWQVGHAQNPTRLPNVTQLLVPQHRYTSQDSLRMSYQVLPNGSALRYPSWREMLIAIATYGGGGSGTINLQTGYGLIGGPITNTGMIRLDTTAAKSKASALADYNNLKAMITAAASQTLQVSVGTSGLAGDGRTYTNTALAGKVFTLFQNGINRYLLPSEYTVTGSGGFVLANALTSGDIVYLVTTGLMGSSGGGGVTPVNLVTRETPSGAVNGSNKTFTLSRVPAAGSEMLFRNGVLQDYGSDYTMSGATITTIFTPATNEKLRISYSY